MTRYRSPTIDPGANPAPSLDADMGASRPIAEADGTRGDPEADGAAFEEGVASPVAIWEIDDRASPQEGQKRLPTGTCAEQAGQRIRGSTPELLIRKGMLHRAP